MDILIKSICYHCGDSCISDRISKDEKSFCCHGCLNVYEILSSSKLGNYYLLNHHPGESQKGEKNKFAFLNEEEIASKIIHYQDANKTIVSFYIPAIHCSSCIWLLEHLNTLRDGILENRVDFLKKQVHIQFNQQKISLKEIAELLSEIGYEPLVNFQDVVNKDIQKKDDLIPKIALAGFCFGNAMLLSFPAYFGLSLQERDFGRFFSLLSLLFCIPSVFYSGSDYFKQAYKSLKKGVLNIDFPLALGISVLFLRTIFDYAFYLGDGFADSLTGLIFFLLIGKFVQQKTYHHISFERDYRSFFPVAVDMIQTDGITKPVALEQLKEGDRILVKNEEIIPADAILLRGNALIDFSFVTGEAEPVNKTLGEIIYAGGRQKGSALELEVVKPVSQSYLTGLWNNEAFQKNREDKIQTFVNKVSHYFSIVLMVIALVTFLYWLPHWETGLNAFTAVLIVACPCALALSTPFTMSAALSIFDKNKFYLKSTDVVEQLAAIDTIVFDKTGTVTIADANKVSFSCSLADDQKRLIYSACANSTHPLSRKICTFLDVYRATDLKGYKEIPGKGILAQFQSDFICLGSKDFVDKNVLSDGLYPEVHVSINLDYLGYFTVKQEFREGLKPLLRDLNENYSTYLISGDNRKDEVLLKDYFSSTDDLFFSQSPQNKLDFIKRKQEKNAKILMIGDGLNDAGALKQSHAGIAITDHINNFTPGSDAILDGEMLYLLPSFLRFSKAAVKIVHISFVIAICYNIIGISFAIQGLLSPLIAAILMPISTVTIISFTSIATHLAAKKHQLIS
ncbi:MAG: heavy metal translocating P-type ATPase metal-binding domain-containing protein [Bacteroidetes bacterium]|nr:heavy metal translocating P-type ATPase metal-binding domain-containing protein [Bacteroidota bacterium]MBU1485111.1 heavy metal translocating P-type ATPase metal-binding domain-containing protein [Bacteroidota bacterium]MBU1761508.1 heavy metal translocating P-type ATPase metal-binding domain-containing protein [Bacteroidota bacterium]MBU2045112.1 heavy metal translocating P-type ATPase metal-binding domain-containing protein [Bacteroidota bacterium]MBU2267945.1 heavy metal translocating P-